MAMTTATIVAMTATWNDSANRSLISSQIGAPVHMDLPKSSRAAPQSHVTNCFQSGWSSPKRMRSFSSASLDTTPLSPAMRSSTTSPGTTRMRRKISTATPRSVGNMRRNRFTRYFHMAPTSSRPRVRGPTLLGQPDGVELVVQVVARRHRPALDLRAVRDDAMPLERVEDVHLFVDQPLLERAHELLPLLGIRGPPLLLEQVVDHLVLVLAVVGVRARDEAEQVQV